MLEQVHKLYQSFDSKVQPWYGSEEKLNPWILDRENTIRRRSLIIGKRTENMNSHEVSLEAAMRMRHHSRMIEKNGLPDVISLSWHECPLKKDEEGKEEKQCMKQLMSKDCGKKEECHK